MTTDLVMLSEPALARRVALCTLVSMPDAFDDARTHTWTQDGHPDRFQWWADLPKVYVAMRQHAREEGIQ